MLTNKDLELLRQKNISVEQIHYQLSCFKNGFPFLPLKASASTKKGILNISHSLQAEYLEAWDTYLQGSKKVMKFVPASGAASRMFKDVFEFLDASYESPRSDFEKFFFSKIENFAFFDDLNQCCLANESKDVLTLIAEGKYKLVAKNLLEKSGLAYGYLPKGLLKFHKYSNGSRTAMEEHLVEGALYAQNAKKEVNLHFTVSPEHRSLFEKLVNKELAHYERDMGVKYNVGFSEQKSSTDTIAADMNNQPFREENGSLLFRPAGHGALIENLKELDADIVFIKNVDNIVPDSFKEITIIYKKIIAGILVKIQKQCFAYIEQIETGKYTHEKLVEMLAFLQNELCVKNPETKILEDVELVLYIKSKLDRPIRVCGMVKNQGEPGGGPFIASNGDKTSSLQILESSQIDLKDTIKKELFESGTHFNPVDLVCSLKNYLGKSYELGMFVDKNTGFISIKSKNGKQLQALELPGLWNGAMSDWNTIFVEVPIETFNPVKTVNDLLRPQHQ